MSRESQRASIEITEQEIRVLWYVPIRERKGVKGLNMTSVIFDSFTLSSGVIEQGIVRQPMELTRLLDQCLKNRRIKGKAKVRITIPMSNGFVREYSLPWVSKRERLQMITYLADEEIPIPADERAFDYWIIEDELDQRIRVVLSGIRKAILTSYTTCFEAAGFSIESIGFSPMAWAHALDLEPNQRTLLIKEHLGFYQMFFYNGRIPEMTRTVRYDPQRIQGIEDQDAEIQRTLAYFLTLQESGDIQQIVVSDGTETTKLGQRICAYLRQEKGIEPQLQTIGDEPEKMLAAMGMALHVGSDYPNNFWREKAGIKEWQRKRWIVVFLLLSLSIAGLEVRNRLLQEVDILEREVSQLKADREVMIQSLNEEAKRTQEWLQLVKHPTSVGTELAQLQSLAGNGIRFERLEYKEETLIIQGDATQPALVQDVLNKLVLLEWDQPRLTSYHQDENRESNDERIKFTLTAKNKMENRGDDVAFH